MLDMTQLDYGNIGDYKTVILEDDLLLDDSGFSDKEMAIAKKGDTITIRHCPNYGLVSHPVHGSFRY